MDLYNNISYELAEHLTKRYSTSFSMSSRLFSADVRPHIYAIYGMVRIADEIVDTYRGDDAGRLLDEFEEAVYAACQSEYSTNPILQAFSVTAKKFTITTELIQPFFASMRMDLHSTDFSKKQYQEYIYGSAEVVGLMCLRVFVGGDNERYEALKDGAKALGAAYQKVNFLRDMKADYQELGRVYFPGVEFDSFSEDDKQAIASDIEQDFLMAKTAIDNLPASAKSAVKTSYVYYYKLFERLQCASVEDIKSKRIRVPNWQKILLYAQARLSI